MGLQGEAQEARVAQVQARTSVFASGGGGSARARPRGSGSGSTCPVVWAWAKGPVGKAAWAGAPTEGPQPRGLATWELEQQRGAGGLAGGTGRPGVPVARLHHETQVAPALDVLTRHHPEQDGEALLVATDANTSRMSGCSRRYPASHALPRQSPQQLGRELAGTGP